MSDDLPSEFDILVVGTGLPESVVAAACSRVGKTVLHIDPNDFYGSQWASFNLESFEKHLTAADAGKVVWTATEDEKKELLSNSRRFNIDLCPKVLFSCGALVQLLISSNIGRYAEFRALDKICTIFEGEVRNVPCSRTDVFNTKELNIVEKRMLMKLLTMCMSYDEKKEEFSEHEGKTFLEFLKTQKLTEKIINIVITSISMCNEDTVLVEGIQRTNTFLRSLGKYGNTPFLFPMYGCGEIPQCFCRLCAVFGGIYCLKKSIECIEAVEGGGWSIKVAEQDIKVGKVLFGSDNVPRKFVQPKTEAKTEQTCGQFARGVFITTEPIGNEELSAGGGGVNLMRLPGVRDQSNGAFVVQLWHYSGTCPKGYYIIHITAESTSSNPEEDLHPYTSQIFKDNSPKTLFTAYFHIPKCVSCESDLNGTNLFTTCGPFFELDYEQSLRNAQQVFKTIYPDEEYLPRAPDPEEIILGDEDPEALCETNLTEDLREQLEKSL